MYSLDLVKNIPIGKNIVIFIIMMRQLLLHMKNLNQSVLYPFAVFLLRLVQQILYDFQSQHKIINIIFVHHHHHVDHYGFHGF